MVCDADSASSAFLCVLGVKPNAANDLAQSTQRYAEFRREVILNKSEFTDFRVKATDASHSRP
jgi:hypothetical protein